MLDPERYEVAERAGVLAALTPGRSGNLSVRRGDRFAVTPTGVPYEGLRGEDVPVVDLEGEHLAGELAPSSETPMHAALYDALDAGAVAHVHSPWATTLSVLREALPGVHYGLARAGRRVPVAAYATYGTPGLAANAVDAMTDADATACLLANHGQVAVGSDADDALETARAVETTARVYCQARALGEPVVLQDDELDRVAERFDDYGQGE